VNRIAFTVYGKPVGVNENHVGGARPFVKSREARAFAAAVANAGLQARVAAGEQTWLGPVRVRIEVYLENERPDTDGCVKAVFDALQAPNAKLRRVGAGIVRNDRQVVGYQVELRLEPEQLERTAAVEARKRDLRALLPPAKRAELVQRRLVSSVRRFE